MLRPADEGDVETMRAWRNQPANREVSIQQHEIDPDEHRSWWGRVKDDPTRRVLVFEYDDRALGVVTFFDLDLDEQVRTGAWGFYLDSDTTAAEGITVLAWMRVMKEATDYAFDELGLDVLDGEVLEDNEAVRNMNRRYRFVEGEPTRREVDGRTVTVIPITLRREDRRATKRKVNP